MNHAVLERFVKLVTLALVLSMLGVMLYRTFDTGNPGDYPAEKGDIHLSSGEWEAAIADFDTALEKDSGHYGAMMGRAVALSQLGRTDAAREQFDDLIAYLEQLDDPNREYQIQGTLAAAYANRGILMDRTGHHRQALDDYIAAMRTDPDVVEGPGVVGKILHDPTPSTIRKRAEYLAKELEKPEEKRLLRVPEKDAEERQLWKP